MVYLNMSAGFPTLLSYLGTSRRTVCPGIDGAMCVVFNEFSVLIVELNFPVQKEN